MAVKSGSAWEQGYTVCIISHTRRAVTTDFKPVTVLNYGFYTKVCMTSIAWVLGTGVSYRQIPHHSIVYLWLQHIASPLQKHFQFQIMCKLHVDPFWNILLFGGRPMHAAQMFLFSWTSWGQTCTHYIIMHACNYFFSVYIIYSFLHWLILIVNFITVKRG